MHLKLWKEFHKSLSEFKAYQEIYVKQFEQKYFIFDNTTLNSVF